MAQKQQPTLLEDAVDAASAASRLAAGLAHAGAAKNIVDTVQQCVSILHQAAKALGSGPPLDQGQQQPTPGGAPEGSPAEEAAESPAQERAEQQQAPAQPPAKQRSAHHAMLAAAHATQAAMAASSRNQK